MEQFEVQGGHPDLWLADSFLFLLLVNSPNLPTFFSGVLKSCCYFSARLQNQNGHLASEWSRYLWLSTITTYEVSRLARNVPLVFWSVVIFRREFKFKMAVLASRNVPFGECCYFWSTSNSKSMMAILVSDWLYYFGFVLQN